jgi:bifunctional isochorismate lyase/aryl carrier protein
MTVHLTREQMRADLGALLRIDAHEIADDDNLLDHGLDSMRLMRLAQQWNDRGIAVSFAALAERPELAHWWRLVSASREQETGA